MFAQCLETEPSRHIFDMHLPLPLLGKSRFGGYGGRLIARQHIFLCSRMDVIVVLLTIMERSSSDYTHFLENPISYMERFFSRLYAKNDLHAWLVERKAREDE